MTDGRWRFTSIRRDMRIAFIAFLVLFAGACVGQRPRARFLDVTAATVPPEPGHAVETGLCASPDSRPDAAYPLRLQLLGTDRQTYRRMERVAMDVRISNVSSAPVLVPSSPIPIRRLDRPVSGYRHAGLEFVLIDAKRRRFATDTFVLYGTPATDTLARLEPGESITFRVPAMLSGSGFQDERNPILYPAPGLRIAVAMWLFAPDDERFRCRFEPSVNTLPVAIGPTIAAVAAARSDGRPPIVRAIDPEPTSADQVVRIAGYRLGADDREHASVTFSNGSVSLAGRVGDSSYASNDRSNGLQTLSVTVPREAYAGTWHVTIHRGGVSSPPFPLRVDEWQAPRIDATSPAHVTPGSAAIVRGANFRYHDRLELTDSRGVVYPIGGGALSDQVDIFVPPYVAEGPATIRIRATKDGEAVFSNSTSVTVIRGPAQPVRAMRQPTKGVAQEASDAGAIVDVIRVGPSDQIVNLTEGPDRPETFNAVTGDLLVFHFTHSVDGDAIVRFSGRDGSIQRRSVRQDEYHAAVRLPEKMNSGPWRIDVRKETGRRHWLPIRMIVHKRPD
jgi:hypothetical protein